MSAESREQSHRNLNCVAASSLSLLFSPLSLFSSPLSSSSAHSSRAFLLTRLSTAMSHRAPPEVDEYYELKEVHHGIFGAPDDLNPNRRRRIVVLSSATKTPRMTARRQVVTASEYAPPLDMRSGDATAARTFLMLVPSGRCRGCRLPRRGNRAIPRHTRCPPVTCAIISTCTAPANPALFPL